MVECTPNITIIYSINIFPDWRRLETSWDHKLMFTMFTEGIDKVRQRLNCLTENPNKTSLCNQRSRPLSAAWKNAHWRHFHIYFHFLDLEVEAWWSSTTSHRQHWWSCSIITLCFRNAKHLLLHKQQILGEIHGLNQTKMTGRTQHSQKFNQMIFHCLSLLERWKNIRLLPSSVIMTLFYWE